MGLCRSSRDAALLLTPFRTVDSAAIRPRNEGSAAIGPSRGSALRSPAMVARTLPVAAYRSPL